MPTLISVLPEFFGNYFLDEAIEIVRLLLTLGGVVKMITGRWMVLALVSSILGVVGLRVEYLQRCEEFHRHEALRFKEMIGTQKSVTSLEVDAALRNAAENPKDFRLDHKFRRVFHHQKTASLYRHAVYRPWEVVREPELEKKSCDD